MLDIGRRRQKEQICLTETEKRQNGQFYDTRDPDLRKQQNSAKDLMKEYNALPAGDLDGRRRLLYELVGHLGRNVRVNQPIYVDYGKNIFLADNSFVNMHCTFLDTAQISIGKNTLIGPDVKIYTATHPVDGSERFFYGADGTTAIKTRAFPVHIGSYTWIGGGAVILPGVTIGDNVVIGAGSVVTEPIPDNAVAAGNPCRVIRYNPPLKYSGGKVGKAEHLINGKI